MLQGCSNKSDTVMINKNVTRLTAQGCNNTAISWLYWTCWNNHVTSLIISTRLLQVVNCLFQTCWQLVTSSAKTTCWRLVDELVTRCEIFACVPFNILFYSLRCPIFIIFLIIFWIFFRVSQRHVETTVNGRRTMIHF
jgi:hypothetical protein